MKTKITINTQSSIRMEQDLVLYFDPFKIDTSSHDADYIFITHDHYDHLDVTSIEHIKKENTILIVPTSILNKVQNLGFRLEQIVSVEPNQTYSLASFSFETVPSYNQTKPFHPKENRYVGYLLHWNGESLYVAGDTDITEEAQKVVCDVALVPIGGTFTMNVIEASSLINQIHPKVAIPTHYGSIVGTKQEGLQFQSHLDPSIECIILIS